jgi:hypothetical protein
MRSPALRQGMAPVWMAGYRQEITLQSHRIIVDRRWKTEQPPEA